MQVTFDSISKKQSYDNSCTCSDMQTCSNTDFDVSAKKTTASMKIFDSESKLLHATTIAKMPLNAYLASREATSWIVSGLLMIYIVVLVLSKKYMSVLGIVLFTNKNKNPVYRDFSYGFTQTANLLIVFSMFILSIFFYLVELYVDKIHKIPLYIFAIIAATVCCYVFFKLIVIKIIGYVSENNELKSKLFAVEIIILSIYGLFSGFFLTLCFSSPSNSINIWLVTISAIIILLYLFKISKIIMIFIDEKISPFFLILYLCGIEILPVWLIIDFL